MYVQMILIIDNYDSFVYNLAQYVGELGFKPCVYRNDKISHMEIEDLAPTHIIISPGPCTPLEAGISNDIIKRFSGKLPILGVCLGHQCIGHVFGASIVRANVPMHGKSSQIIHDGKTIYRNLPNPFEAGRYHSLVIKPATIPAVLEVSSRTKEGEIMGVRHIDYRIEGVQFHPESIMTSVGHQILQSFLGDTQAAWTK